MLINLSCNVGVMKTKASQAIHCSHEEKTRQLDERHPVRKVRSTNSKMTILYTYIPLC